MKNVWSIGLFSLAALTLQPGSASAGWLFHHCSCTCTYKVVCKQYNAFSPFCPVCPPCAGLCIPQCAPPCNPCGGCPDGACSGGTCTSCADGSCGGATVTTPTTGGALPTPNPLPSGPTFTAPAPAAAPVSALPMNGTMPVNYQPMYYPSYPTPMGYGYGMVPYGYQAAVMPAYYGMNGR